MMGTFGGIRGEFELKTDGKAQVTPPEPPKRNRGTKKPLHNFTMRLAMDDAAKFIRFCERERLSYREAFALLVAKIEE